MGKNSDVGCLTAPSLLVTRMPRKAPDPLLEEAEQKTPQIQHSWGAQESEVGG